MDARSRRAATMVMAAAVAISLGSCSREIGRNFDPARADQLIPGTSTLLEATALMGSPARTKSNASGITVATWRYLKDKPGGTESATLAIRFGSDGKMQAVLRNSQNRIE